jgi:hypothetical protein
LGHFGLGSWVFENCLAGLCCSGRINCWDAAAHVMVGCGFYWRSSLPAYGAETSSRYLERATKSLTLLGYTLEYPGLWSFASLPPEMTNQKVSTTKAAVHHPGELAGAG